MSVGRCALPACRVVVHVPVAVLGIHRPGPDPASCRAGGSVEARPEIAFDGAEPAAVAPLLLAPIPLALRRHLVFVFGISAFRQCVGSQYTQTIYQYAQK